LIDLQVNGCAGTDYNAWPLEAEAVKQSAIALRETGVTGFLPTIITNSPDRIAGLLDGFSSMLEQDHQLRELVIGHTAANGEQISGNDDYLAGSALPVIRGVENLVAAGLADINDAWDLASGAPARFLDLPERGQLAPGRRADLVLFQVSDGRFEIERVLVGNADRGPDHTSP
jgi:N-acetylglucosamine-6-phosphate deacetylase